MYCNPSLLVHSSKQGEDSTRQEAELLRGDTAGWRSIPLSHCKVLETDEDIFQISTICQTQTSFKCESAAEKQKWVKSILLASLSTAGRDLLSIAENGKSVEELKNALQQSHVGVALDPSTGRNALHLASKRGSLAFVQCILEYLREKAPEEVFFRQQLNAGDHMGFTALSLAVRYRRTEVVEVLLEAGAAVQPTSDPLSHKKTKYGVDFSDSLFIAVDLGNEEIVKSLLTRLDAAGVNKLSREGCSALHIAFENLDLPMMVALLNAGGDLSIKSRWGRTPIVFAAQKGDEHFRRLVTLLLNTRELKNPIDFASLGLDKEKMEIVRGS